MIMAGVSRGNSRQRTREPQTPRVPKIQRDHTHNGLKCVLFDSFWHLVWRDTGPFDGGSLDMRNAAALAY
jgi:hypothetical protein